METAPLGIRTSGFTPIAVAPSSSARSNPKDVDGDNDARSHSAGGIAGTYPDRDRPEPSATARPDKARCRSLIEEVVGEGEVDGDAGDEDDDEGDEGGGGDEVERMDVEGPDTALNHDDDRGDQSRGSARSASLSSISRSPSGQQQSQQPQPQLPPNQQLPHPTIWTSVLVGEPRPKRKYERKKPLPPKPLDLRPKRKYVRRKPYLKNGIWVDPTASALTPPAPVRMPPAAAAGGPLPPHQSESPLFSRFPAEPERRRSPAGHVPLATTTSDENDTPLPWPQRSVRPHHHHRHREPSPDEREPTPPVTTPTAAVSALDELEQQAQDYNDSWETESLFKDMFAELADSENSYLAEGSDGGEPDGFSPAQGNRLRQELRRVGPAEFCARYLDSGLYTARKLLTAFGLRTPPWIEGAGDEACFNLLVLAITRELSKRAKLTRFNSVDDAVRLIAESRNIMVITGAGISTSLGIPDFRSKNGLYAQLGDLGLSDPQEVFDITLFREDPTIFYRVARDIWPSTDRYTPTHKFIAMLQARGKLLTNYSQNIDNLEAKAGIRPDKLVQCHGSFATATCIRCAHKVPGDDIFDDVHSGRLPRCRRCVGPSSSLSSSRPPAKRKRTTDDDDEDDDGVADGIMKPDITFFGESLPDEFSRRLTEVDRDLVDLVIVIGTSLKVSPVSEMVGWLPAHVPQIYISRQPVSHINFDIDLLGDCDDVVVELCRRLAWPMVHEMVPPGRAIRVMTEEGFPSRHLFEPVRSRDEGSSAKSTPAPSVRNSIGGGGGDASGTGVAGSSRRSQRKSAVGSGYTKR